MNALRKVPQKQLLSEAAKLFFSGMWGLTLEPEESGWNQPLWNLIDQGMFAAVPEFVGSRLPTSSPGKYDPWIDSVILTINKDEGTFFSRAGKVTSEISNRGTQVLIQTSSGKSRA